MILLGLYSSSRYFTSSSVNLTCTDSDNSCQHWSTTSHIEAYWWYHSSFLESWFLQLALPPLEPTHRDQRVIYGYQTRQRTVLGQEPRKRNLRHADILLFGNFFNTSDNGVRDVRFCSGVHINKPARRVDDSWSAGRTSTYPSVSLLFDFAACDRVRPPRASGDQGIDPTPKCCSYNTVTLCKMSILKIQYLKRRNHFTLFLSVNEIIMILYRDEWC